MAKVEFHYKKYITTIKCSENEKMEEICKRYIKIEKDLTSINDLDFFYLGNKINLELTLSQIIGDKDIKTNLMIIYVDKKKSENKSNDIIIKSKLPICPECKKNIILEMNDFKISCSRCKNRYLINNILIKDYEKSRKYNIATNEYNESKINTSKIDSENHICKKHNQIYNSYCKKCNINICLYCKCEHENHEIILYEKILTNKIGISNEFEKFKNIIQIFNNDIEKLVYKFNNVKENLISLCNIYYELIQKYENKNINYEILMSLNNFTNKNSIIKNLKEINQIENIHNKIKNILDIYEKMNFYQISSIYEYK